MQDGSEKRLIFSGLKMRKSGPDDSSSFQIGVPFAEIDMKSNIPREWSFSSDLMVRTSKGDVIEIRGLKVESSTEDMATKSALKGDLFRLDPVVEEKPVWRAFVGFRGNLG